MGGLAGPRSEPLYHLGDLGSIPVDRFEGTYRSEELLVRFQMCFTSGITPQEFGGRPCSKIPEDPVSFSPKGILQI